MNQQQFYSEMERLAREGVDLVLSRANHRIIKDAPAGGQTAVAEILGIGRAAVCKWDAVPLQHVRKLCKAYELSPEQVRPDLFAAPRLLRELAK